MRRTQQRGRPRGSGGKREVTPIYPTGVYTATTAGRALGIKKETMTAFLREGKIQSRWRLNRYMILGQWLLDWVASEGEEPRKAPHLNIA